MTEVRLPLRMTYDAQVDAAYIYFVAEIAAGVVDRTVSADPAGTGGMVNMDLDASGHILGVEVLDASRHLPAELLAALRAG